MTNMEKAEEHFRLAILYASSHVNAHFNLGQLYLCVFFARFFLKLFPMWNNSLLPRLRYCAFFK